MIQYAEEIENRGAEGGTRTPTSCLTRPSNVRVCQFRHFGIELSDNETQTHRLRFRSTAGTLSTYWPLVMQRVKRSAQPVKLPALSLPLVTLRVLVWE